MEEKTQINDIDRSIYDIKDEEKDITARVKVNVKRRL